MNDQNEKNFKAAVVLSGCGHLDGTEIREAVLSLLVLDQQKVEVKCFAPDVNITHVINHKTKEKTEETRNILIEAARIARGEIGDLKEAKAEHFDMLVVPGGYGVIKNLVDIHKDKNSAKIAILSEFERLVLAFFNAKKPIGAICIAPAAIVAILSNKIGKEGNKIKVTIGDDQEQLIEKVGGTHIRCSTALSIEDKAYGIFSCAAYMGNSADIYTVYQGIKHMIRGMVKKLSLMHK